MPIFDQSYRAYTGQRTGRVARIATIAYAGIRPLLRKRVFLLFLLYGAMRFLGNFFVLYARDYASLIPVPGGAGPLERILPAGGPKLFFDFLVGDQSLTFIVATWVGAGLVADDIASGALPLYLSRPISRIDYACGKLFSIISVGSLLTLLPALLLWILLATKAVGHGDAPPISLGAASVVASMIILVGYGMTLLAMSSLTSSRRMAMVAFAAVLAVSSGVSELLASASSNNPWMELISFSGLFRIIGRALFNPTPETEIPALLPFAAAAILAGLLLLSALILWIRISSRSRP